MAKKRTPVKELRRKRGELQDSQAAGYLAEERTQTRRPAARVLAIPLGQIWPDRFQPRPILPAHIKSPFYRGEMDWRQTAEAWLQEGRGNEALQQRIDVLLNMGDTIDEHGQIKPATGYWRGDGQDRQFYLETGERRYWAKALRAVIHEETEEPLLEVREVAEPSRMRQVIENRHAEQPNAVARAREIAALVLSALNIHPDDNLVDDETLYFQQALDIKRLPPGLWDEVGVVMGVSRPVMVRTMNILKLPLHLLDLADLYNVPERSLREILALPQGQWEKALKAAIKEGWTFADYEEHALEVGKKSPGKKKAALTTYEKAGRRGKSFLKLAVRPRARKSIGRVATEIAAGFDDQEIQTFAEYLEELAGHLRLRAQGEGS